MKVELVLLLFPFFIFVAIQIFVNEIRSKTREKEIMISNTQAFSSAISMYDIKELVVT